MVSGVRIDKYNMNEANKCLKCGRFVQGGVEECLDCIARENQVQCVKCKGHFLNNGQTGAGGSKDNFVCNQCNWKQPNERGEKCGKCHKQVKNLNGFSNGRTGEHFSLCDDCYKCSQCKKKNIETITNEQSNK